MHSPFASTLLTTSREKFPAFYFGYQSSKRSRFQQSKMYWSQTIKIPLLDPTLALGLLSKAKSKGNQTSSGQWVRHMKYFHFEFWPSFEVVGHMTASRPQLSSNFYFIEAIILRFDFKRPIVQSPQNSTNLSLNDSTVFNVLSFSL